MGIVNFGMEVIQKCFAEKLKDSDIHERIKEMIPSYDESLIPAEKAIEQSALKRKALETLGFAYRFAERIPIHRCILLEVERN